MSTIIILIALIAVAAVIYLGSNKSPDFASMPASERRTNFDIEKPEGYIYYESGLSVAGITRRQSECKRCLKQAGERAYLYLEAEPNNAHDRNAIRIMGKGGFHLGYVDKETAAEIAQDGILSELLIYPKSAYITKEGNLLINYALLKPGKRFKPEQKVNHLEFPII